MATALKGLGVKLEKLPAAIVDAAVARFDELARASAASVVGNSGTMMMHTRRGRVPARMGTRAVVHGTGNSTVAFVYAKPPGAWAWIETGTTAHLIGKGKFRGKGANRKMSATFLKGAHYEHPVRGPVMHMGSHGKRAWSRAVDEFRLEYPDVAIKLIMAAVKG